MCFFLRAAHFRHRAPLLLCFITPIISSILMLSDSSFHLPIICPSSLGSSLGLISTLCSAIKRQKRLCSPTSQLFPSVFFYPPSFGCSQLTVKGMKYQKYICPWCSKAFEVEILFPKENPLHFFHIQLSLPPLP